MASTSFSALLDPIPSREPGEGLGRTGEGVYLSGQLSLPRALLPNDAGCIVSDVVGEEDMHEASQGKGSREVREQSPLLQRRRRV